MSGIRRGVHEIFALFGHYAEQNDDYGHIVTISAPFQRVKQSKKDPLKATGTNTFPYVLTFIFPDSKMLSKYFM
jgi:hypothetical protein